VWLFFDQAFLRDREVALSTFLLTVKTHSKRGGQPVDKSVVKLWKDSAEGRSYWPAAIAGLTGNPDRFPQATHATVEGQAKKFVICSQSLVHSGFQLLHLPPECVDGAVDKVRAVG
jgi:hypothetical protein